MKICVSASSLNGEIAAVSSKSDAHRAVICAALCDKVTEVSLGEFSDDINATVDCLTAMGADIKRKEDGFIFGSGAVPGKDATLNCRESGSTLRFLLPVAAALGGRKGFYGAGRLPSRPMLPLMNALESHNIAFDNKKLPFVSIGKMTGGEFSVPGNISSQFISGILLALPLTDGGGTVTVTDGLQSSGYVDMTVRTMQRFGVECSCVRGTSYSVASGSHYVSPGNYRVEGDWSGAAFFLVAGAIAGDITVRGLDPESAQADRAILEVLRDFGANITCDGDRVRVRTADARPFSVDVSDCPDIFPILAVLACKANGKSVLYNASRLRLKESDRVATTAEMLRAFNVRVDETEDSLTVYGYGGIEGGAVRGAGDHRIVMSAAVASLMCGKKGNGSVMITDAEAISKSYPSFFRDLTTCGGRYFAV
ncbi:MAG: 3-phosphoshikimate 1-carboxyvinyltransferase [Clostridia bacterium]|nr:3-phosphoshikimate 1-carboxyvinyltransferase [Clostridia bacterium]